ncbi:MAG: hypothetical protein ACHQNA_03000, partial [Acidimicrobiales bacterium]
MPLTIGTDRFEADLPSRNVARFVQPLSHQLSVDAPVGLISGLLEPVGTPRVRAGGPALRFPPPPAERSAGGSRTTVARQVVPGAPVESPASPAPLAEGGSVPAAAEPVIALSPVAPPLTRAAPPADL